MKNVLSFPTRGMMRAALLLVSVLGFQWAMAQSGVGINTTGASAAPSAGLDVDFSNKGMLIPRVPLLNSSDVSTIASPATSLLVYNTALSGDVTPGFYFYNGLAWERLATGAGGGGGGSDWTTSGNNTWLTNTSGRVGIGTSSPSSSYDLTLQGGSGGGFLVRGSGTNSKFEGNVGIGFSTSSSYELDVDGAVRIQDYMAVGTTPSSSYELRVSGSTYLDNIRVGTSSSPPSGGILSNGIVDAASFRAGPSSSNSNGVYCTGEIRSNNAFNLGSSTTGTGTAVVRTSGGLLRPQSSTVRVKDNVQELNIDKEKFLQLRAVSFNLKPALGGDPDVGLIAEEVEKLVPDLVVYGPKRNWIGDTGLVEQDEEGADILDYSQQECYSVRYDKVGVYLISIVADQEETIKSQQQELEELKARMDRQDALIMKLVMGTPEIRSELLNDGTLRAESNDEKK